MPPWGRSTALTAVLHPSLIAIVQGIASRAIDGNAATSWGGGSCTHTGTQSNPWCRVLLPAFSCMAVLPSNAGLLHSCIACNCRREIQSSNQLCGRRWRVDLGKEAAVQSVTVTNRGWVLAHHGCGVAEHRFECCVWMQGCPRRAAFKF